MLSHATVTTAGSKGSRLSHLGVLCCLKQNQGPAIQETPQTSGSCELLAAPPKCSPKDCLALAPVPQGPATVWRQSSLWQGAQGPSLEERGVTSGKEIITETESFPISSS